MVEGMEVNEKGGRFKLGVRGWRGGLKESVGLWNCIIFFKYI